LRKHRSLFPGQSSADRTKTIKLSRQALSVKLTHKMIGYRDAEDCHLFARVPIVAVIELVLEIHLVANRTSGFLYEDVGLPPRDIAARGEETVRALLFLVVATFCVARRNRVAARRQRVHKTLGLRRFSLQRNASIRYILSMLSKSIV